MSNLSIFLSHTYEERKLAGAFKWLIRSLSNKNIDVWYSSDPRPSGGTALGDWRDKIHKKLNKADEVIAIITPESNNKSWIAYETGFSHGIEKITTPVFFFMKRKNINLFDSNISSYNGNEKKEINKLLELLFIKSGIETDTDNVIWNAALEEYLKRINKEEEKLRGRQLFQDHFHDAKNAESMEDIVWHAVWTQIDENGAEQVFEADTLKCWSTDNRIRFVGDGAKNEPYPMEGVRSHTGHMALSYWSSGQIPICGTALLKPNLSRKNFTGTWSGYTAETLDADELKYTHGRVFMSQDEKAAAKWRADQIDKPASK